MNESQRAAALRLADELQRFDGTERESLRDEAADLLRELASEPVVEPVAWISNGSFKWHIPNPHSSVRLRAALHFARSDERHYMADRVDSLTKQLLAMEARYMALLKYVVDNVAMPPRPLVMTLDAARAALKETP